MYVPARRGRLFDERMGRILNLFLLISQVGVQCEVQPEAGASALEDKVNAVLPLQIKEGDTSEHQPALEESALAPAPSNHDE